MRLRVGVASAASSSSYRSSSWPRRQPAARRVAAVTGVAGDRVARGLASGRPAVVATDASTDHLRVVDTDDEEVPRAVASIAVVRRKDVGGAFTRGTANQGR